MTTVPPYYRSKEHEATVKKRLAREYVALNPQTRHTQETLLQLKVGKLLSLVESHPKNQWGFE